MPKGRGSNKRRSHRRKSVLQKTAKNWRKRRGLVAMSNIARFLKGRAKRGLGSKAITTIEMKKG